MIFDPCAVAERSPVQAHIEAGIAAAGVPPEGIDGWAVEEVARAIEHLLADVAPGGFVDARTLNFLAARALQAVGAAGSARHLLLYGSGMVKPSEWTVTGDQAVWVLDLKQLTVAGEARLELVLFRCMHLIIETMADLWDASRGDGVLGLRHVCEAAADLLGEPGRTASVNGLTTEILASCGEKLEQLRQSRGWTTSPRVMVVDAL
jgi:hypothetical protein